LLELLLVGLLDEPALPCPLELLLADDAALAAAAAAAAAETASAWAAVSATRVALAWATDALAEITASRSALRSSTASVSPMSTWSPTLAATVLTVPDVPNGSCAWWRGVTVPVVVKVCSTEPRVAADVR
jgi:hypothetical protein